MVNTKIIQIVPIGAGVEVEDRTEYGFLMPNEDTGRNEVWYIAGVALMEDNRLLPYVWDGTFVFKVIDPVKLSGIKFIGRLVQRMYHEHNCTLSEAISEKRKASGGGEDE